MVGSAELLHYMRGAVLLARLNPAGAAHFANTPEACWRSFRAMIMAAPLYYLIVADGPSHFLDKAGTAHGALVVGLIYVIGWFLYPLAMLSVTALVGARDKYHRYIGAYNWASLLIYLVLCAAGLLPGDIGDTLSLVVMFAWIAYSVVIAKLSLEIPVSQAVGFAAIEFVISFGVLSVEYSLLGVSQAASG